MNKELLDPHADYGALNDLSRHRINTERIRRHWNDMLRVAGSLKLGTVNAAELVRTLLTTKRPSGLTLAIAALGRIQKTLPLRCVAGVDGLQQVEIAVQNGAIDLKGF
jgi:TnpA family transposase